MKRMLLFICLLFILSGVHAQFQAGQKLLGGQLSFGSNSGNTSTYPSPTSSPADQRYTSFSLNLSLSRFKSPTVLNGGGISYSYIRSRSNIGNPFEQTISTNSLGAFVNKTKLHPLANKLYLSFTGTGYGNYLFGTGTAAASFGSPETKTNTYMLGISGSMGLMYQLNEHFLVSCELSNLLNLAYSHSDIKNTSGGGSTIKTYNDAIGFSTGLSGFSMNSLSFGVRYLFKN